jgi:hypothetical protein
MDPTAAKYIGAGRAAHRVGDEFVGQFRDRLQPAGNHRARRAGADHQRRNADHDDHHEQRRIGKRDLTTAQVDQGHHVVDLKLMNRIDLHDLVTVALNAPIASS